MEYFLNDSQFRNADSKSKWNSVYQAFHWIRFCRDLYAASAQAWLWKQIESTSILFIRNNVLCDPYFQM